jgi:putative endonuclease
MWFSKKEAVKEDVKAPAVNGITKRPTKSVGDAAEALALAYLRKTGMVLLDTNYRTPGRGGGEIDLIMKDKDGTLVFVEVRQRASASHGGAGASISVVKQKRIVFAARHYLMRFKTLPPCRFDVVLIQGELGASSAPTIEWLRSAFDAF